MEYFESPSWGPPSAYLYTLKLDAESLAWEYLRRNRQYISEFVLLAHSKKIKVLPTGWGLLRWEDPREDARIVEPDWLAAGNWEVGLLRGGDDGLTRFDIWQLPGHKVLSHERSHLRLTCRGGSQVLHRGRWPENLAQGDPFIVTVTAGRGFTTQARAAGMLLRSFKQPHQDRLPKRPSAQAITHMQTLQALDGEAAGASHREIARRLYGLGSKRWDGDSRWRARIRYLLRCGRARTQLRRPRLSSVDADPCDGREPSGSLKSALFARHHSTCALHSSIPRVLS